MKSHVYVAFLALSLTACASLIGKREASYVKNVPYTKSVGDVMEWTSIPVPDPAGFPQKFTQELSYVGKSGSTIKIQYRELINGMARPGFDQELTYDLKESDIIMFRHTKMQVMSADNSSITFLVLSDISDSATPPDKK